MRWIYRQSFSFFAIIALSAPVIYAESMFTARHLGDGSLIADDIARQIGDLITVRIRENNSVSESMNTETSRASQIGLSGQVTDANANPSNVPGLTIDSSKDFSGEGTYAQTGAITATLTGRVTDVLDNGNLVIEARRSMRFGNEKKDIIISGVIRPTDVSPQNMIDSDVIHNFQVAIEGEGILSRTQQEGLLSRILDVLWPF